MRNVVLCFLGCALFIACTQKKAIEKDTQLITPTENMWVDTTNSTFKKWKNYYQSEVDSTFNVNKFEFSSEDSLHIIPSNILATFDSAYNNVYSPFLIYNSSKTKYIDLDSYQWSLHPVTNEIVWEADQEINLVDLIDKNVSRIGFLGPSFTVEDAFWQNDSIVILLQNSYDRVPSIQKINFKSAKKFNYIYTDTLVKSSQYQKLRIHQLLKNE